MGAVLRLRVGRDLDVVRPRQRHGARVLDTPLPRVRAGGLRLLRAGGGLGGCRCFRRGAHVAGQARDAAVPRLSRACEGVPAVPLPGLRPLKFPTSLAVPYAVDAARRWRASLASTPLMKKEKESYY